jgi:hypothetical protein
VDLKTLEGFGPIKIKLSCRDAKQVRGETQVYFNKREQRDKMGSDRGRQRDNWKHLQI